MFGPTLPGQRDYRTRIYSNPGRIPAAAWDRLAAADDAANPFLRHAFLDALDASGCATEATGWLPQYLTLWQGDTLAAAVPLYLKSHSYGEYVFDWAWAEAYQQRGLPYYPKLLAAIPFTPVAGTRLLAADATARGAAAQALLALAQQADLSSLHVLLAPAAQLDLLAQQRMLIRSSLQFHWRNRGYEDFAAFLAALTQPKRKKIRAERRKVADAGVRLERRVGAEITPDDWRFFHRCYERTYAAHWSTPYLNLEFFQRLAAAMPEHLMLVLAWRDQQPVASALGVFDQARGTLFGRYWGASAAIDCLHFECCYYQMIEFAIERRLQVFEGGAQGAHKLARGLDPVETRSAHWLRAPQMHAAVARFIARERAALAASIDELDEHRALRVARAPEAADGPDASGAPDASDGSDLSSSSGR